ncbi:hypothetical protein O3G_MSEX012643 [Manduca sexta]|uniref:Elongator complex protein 5 n=1 Tax=Manduca sexta TaxID=7130 RepID=A0A921ZPP4_MANSE|nr:hypothetical protein O3G_MSEX012643 [Manduca sexta]
MTLFKLRSAPFVLIEDDINKNTVPLILELVQNTSGVINLFAYEQPITAWRNVFNPSELNCYKEFNPEMFSKYTHSKCTVIIDSINQMSLCLGWNECLKSLKRLQDNKDVEKLIVILHKDCLSHASKLRFQLNHIAKAIVSYDDKIAHKVWVQIKKNSKIIRTEELLSYDSINKVLKSHPVIKEERKEAEPEKPSPGTLSTFKIEVEQTEKLQKYNLKLPYMSKINEGESKVFYEPDAVDDWDEEDPDDDLDI